MNILDINFVSGNDEEERGADKLKIFNSRHK